jgi:hypothetical protein
MGFGAVGIFVSALLVNTTISSHNSAVHSHLVNPHKYPKTPPALSVTDFLLPILYTALSLAYFYLGYRAARKQAAERAATSE